MPDLSNGLTVWFTGLPSSGKTTIAHALEKRLLDAGLRVEVLDGDVVRTHLTKGLGFSKEDRDENIRRIGFVAHLLARNGVVVLASVISPYREIRDEVRELHDGRFVEVYVSTPVDVCAERDVKGLYAKAFSGEIKEFTGVSDPYEIPENPAWVCDTENETPEESAQKLLEWHREKAGSIEAIHDVMKNELAAGVLPCARKIILRLGLGAQRICEWLQARLLLAAPV